MIKIQVGSQTISIPSSGESPNWSQGIIAAFQAIALQLAGIASAFDIPPSVQTLTSDANTNLSINTAIFPSGFVRSFAFSYAIYRTNGVLSLAENGIVNGVFNSATSTWFLEHEFAGSRQSDGSPYHTFAMSGDQLQITTVPIGGAYDGSASKLSFAAKTILVSDI